MSDSPPATSTLRVSVVIPTHNPRMDYLRRVLEALRGQTLEQSAWELVVVDNGSKQPLAADQETKRPRGSEQETGDRGQETGVGQRTNIVDLSWSLNAKIVHEERLGLTFARLRGFAEAKGELIVMVDDDNVLAPDYLANAVRIAQEHRDIGAFGGKCLPEFEVEPEAWLASVRSGLGLRDLGEAPQLFPEETGERGVCPEAVSQSLDSVGQFFGKAVESANPPNDRTTELPKHGVTRRVTEFPDCAPIGAGMVLRREAAAAYAERLRRSGGLRVAGSESEEGQGPEARGRRAEARGRRSEDGGRRSEVGAPPKDRNTETPNHRPAAVITDRQGDSLASGGDNDICLTVIEEGWQVGYFPQLQLTHLIPKRRMTLDYHRRMSRDSMKSYILMLDQHGIRPWPAMPRWTLPLRVASDWWRVKPWKGPEESLQWWGHVGMYEGRAALRSSA